MVQGKDTVIEATNWSEFSLTMHEHDILHTLRFDIDVPCIVQWKPSVVLRSYRGKLGFDQCVIH